MKKIVFTIVGLLLAAEVFAGTTYVNPYVRRDGTFVQGHYRTTPDSSIYNNWSTRGNVNPYTGEAGTVDPYSIIRRRSYNTQYDNDQNNINIYDPDYDD